MKETFVEKKFRPETVEIIEICTKILDDYVAEGYDLTLRQIYYQLVKADLFPDDRRWRLVEKTNKWVRDPNGTKNAPPNYKWLGSIVTDARLAGLMDWDIVVDRGRKTESNPHWNHPGEILQTAATAFNLDKWRYQLVHVEVMCEKQALDGILIPVCSELDVSFTSNRGYSSLSFMYRKAVELAKILADGKHVRILYFGDHDPSGLNMDQDIDGRLRLFIGEDSQGIGNLDLVRVALTKPQINAHGLVPNPAKMSDSRASEYAKIHGEVSWEIDALEPRTLAGLVRSEVKQLRDDGLWKKACKKEKEMQSELKKIAARWFVK